MSTENPTLETEVLEPIAKLSKSWEFPFLSAPSLLGTPSGLEIRAQLQEMVRLHLIGPERGEGEIVHERRVSEHYLCGMLAPENRGDDDEAPEAVESPNEGFAPVESGEAGDSDEADEPPSSDARGLFPSAMGLSFTVPIDEEITEICVSATFGHYKRIDSPEFSKSDGSPALAWQRRPIESTHTFSLAKLEGEGERFYPDEGGEFGRTVWVQGRASKGETQWVVTLFLVNGATGQKNLPDEKWIFQTQLRVFDAVGRAIFQQHQALPQANESDPNYEERMQLLMAYRSCVGFASGHNTSVHAEREAGNFKCAKSLETRAIPLHEVEVQGAPAIQDVAGLEGFNPSMEWLASAPQSEVAASLRALETAYRMWIDGQEKRLDSEADLEPFDAVARENLRGCRVALERMSAGIALLARDGNAFAAFQFANRAMARQRVRSLWIEAQRRDSHAKLSDFDVVGKRSWRPFQLAFILLNLPSLCDPAHVDRTGELDAKADLLWFPTGGGKTEAYLGLTAFTLAIRRLQGQFHGRDGGFGVAVLMRYTLRLLTLQQFQRAAALVCACEVERRKDPKKWGDEPFRLGLWVGAKTTPNSFKDAAEAIAKAKGNKPSAWDRSGFGAGGSTPHQLTQCPWCGREINANCYHAAAKSCRILVHCAAPECEFSARRSTRPDNSHGEGIPAVVVDEEIYRRLPSLLISTVDKFAQMPWNSRTAMLFGRITGRDDAGFTCPEIGAPKVDLDPLRPPDLIIQDELHLISGPLGTLVGLYETVVDALCSWEIDGKVVKPKIVASTATIRNARAQIRALFLREAQIFPPPALDAGDNFFSKQTASSDEFPGRLYVGICAPGKRLKATMIRVYSAYMAAAQTILEKYGAEKADPYLTTVGYFNSMRDLGSMKRLVEDDVTSRLKRMDARGFKKRPAPNDRGFFDPLVVKELTSRRSAAEIPEMLDQMATAFAPAAPVSGPKAYKIKAGKNAHKPLDVLLATNMISVGVDVSRLGLMIVANQPKSSAEYIQATSRVGRAKPGLVCTVFNWARPRDLSHYEGFEHYHATFYQHVEALSVTPFAPRALDRGLTALLVALLRLGDTKWSADDKARLFNQTDDLTVSARKLIQTRAENVTGASLSKTLVEEELQKRIDNWTSRVAIAGKAASGLAYRGEPALLKTPGALAWDNWTCLNSLREVEPMSDLLLLDANLDADPA